MTGYYISLILAQREGRQGSRTREQAENGFTLGWVRFGDCSIKAPGRCLRERRGQVWNSRAKSGLEMGEESTGTADAISVSKIIQGEGTE